LTKEPDIAPGLGTPLRILVVDDSRRVGELMRAILTRVEHAVDVVSSPCEALFRLERVGYDVVISDLYLCKETSGVELARALRRQWPETGFILATGSMALVSATEPVDAVLIKPFRATVLREMVARVAATHCASEPIRWHAW